MMSRLKNSAGPTSWQPLMIASVRDSPGCRRSRCLWAFSIMTMAASIIAPTAIATPPRLMMLALMPSARMPMKAARMPTGSMRMATSAERRWSRKTTQTSATIRLSSVSVCFKVAMARSISSERSYVVTMLTPSGRLALISAILVLTLWMTSSALTPKRAMAMPDTTSPSPFNSVMPRRSSATSSTRPISATRTGVPFCDLRTRFAISSLPRR